MEQVILSPITLTELTDLIESSVRGAMLLQPEPKPEKQDQRIYGIQGLAKFVHCSEPTAVKIARSKKFNRYQDGRKIFFLESEVLKGLKR
jgi:hypothetical protein